MMNQQGIATSRFSEDLVRGFGAQYVVLYDRDNQDKSDQVAACSVLYGTPGDGVHSACRCTKVDARIADSERRVLFLIEMQEQPSNDRKTIGDDFALSIQVDTSLNGADQVGTAAASV